MAKSGFKSNSYYEKENQSHRTNNTHREYHFIRDTAIWIIDKRSCAMLYGVYCRVERFCLCFGGNVLQREADERWGIDRK